MVSPCCEHHGPFLHKPRCQLFNYTTKRLLLVCSQTVSISPVFCNHLSLIFFYKSSIIATKKMGEVGGFLFKYNRKLLLMFWLKSPNQTHCAPSNKSQISKERLLICFGLCSGVGKLESQRQGGSASRSIIPLSGWDCNPKCKGVQEAQQAVTGAALPREGFSGSEPGFSHYFLFPSSI